MKTLAYVALAAGTLVTTPVFAQTSNPQQMLQGLLNGNQSRDQALERAYERGYQAGQHDEARRIATNRNSGQYQNETGDYGGNRPASNEQGNLNNSTSYPAGSYNQNRGD